MNCRESICEPFFSVPSVVPAIAIIYIFSEKLIGMEPPFSLMNQISTRTPDTCTDLAQVDIPLLAWDPSRHFCRGYPSAQG